MGGWMSELLSLCWATSSLGNPFVEAPLPSAICFFSEQLLIWATSALSCFPAASSVASATQFFCSRNAYNAFSNLHLQSRKAQEWHYGLTLPFVQLLQCVRQPQLQSHVPGASQHHLRFGARSRANAFCHSRLQTRIAGAPQQIHQHSRSVNSACVHCGVLSVTVKAGA